MFSFQGLWFRRLRDVQVLGDWFMTPTMDKSKKKDLENDMETVMM